MSIKEELGGLLQEFVNTSANLIDALAGVADGKKNRNPEDIMDEAIEIDKKIRTAVVKLAEQQEFYKKIIHMQTLIAEKDREVNQLATQLKDVELTLQSVLDESKAELESLEKSEKHAVSVEDLVEYAHRVSGTTSAPPQDMDLVDAPRVFKHPFPTATQIQQSLLHLETNPAAVSSAPSAPLDQEYSANMTAPRTALSADLQKDDLGGEAMDAEMHDEDGHYGMDTDHHDEEPEAANITDIFADLNPDLKQQFDAFYRGEVEKLKTRLKTTIKNVQQNREDLENPIYLAIKERAKYQFFKRVDPTRNELDVIKDLRPFAETVLDLLAQLLRFQFDGNLFKEKKLALEKHIEKERQANRLKDDTHLLNLTSAFFSHMDHIRVLGNINTHDNRFKDDTLVEYMMATLGALRMVNIFLDLLESTGFKLLASSSRERNKSKIQMAQSNFVYPTARPNDYDQYTTSPDIQITQLQTLPAATTLEQQMEVQQLLASMFPADQKARQTQVPVPSIRQPVSRTVPLKPSTDQPAYHSHTAALTDHSPRETDSRAQYYADSSAYTTATHTQFKPAPFATPVVTPSPHNFARSQPMYPTQAADYLYPTRNTGVVPVQPLTAPLVAADTSPVSTTIRIKPSLTLDQAEFLKSEEDFDWTTIDFKREFCFLHFKDGESASRALHYFDSIKLIPDYSFLRHYDASMYLKPIKDKK